MADYFDMVIQVKFLQRDQDFGHALLVTPRFLCKRVQNKPGS